MRLILAVNTFQPINLKFVLADLDEVWRALGVSGCPQCLCPDGALADYDAVSPARSFAETLQVIRTCRSLLQERGNVTAVNALLRRYRLSLLHTKIWNPFFMVPHADFDCFPQDHLHGMYVPVWVDLCPLSRMR